MAFVYTSISLLTVHKVVAEPGFLPFIHFNVFYAFQKCFKFIYLKSTWQRAGSATYMPHSQQRHAYKSNTHKIRLT